MSIRAMGPEQAQHCALASKGNAHSSRALTTALQCDSMFSSPLQKREQLVEKVFAMGQGDGEESYSKNSGYQATVNKISHSFLDDALGNMSLLLEHGRSSVVVADLGCGSGLNSIVNVGRIVDKLRRESIQLQDGIHFQVFFNDLPSNDFDNLFRMLSNDSRAQLFSAAGVPGSFYGRLFPSSSVHVFHSSMSIHWMSKVPDAFLDRDSPSYNKGNPWITNASPAVATEYQQQASLDLRSFLLVRAAELVSGGLLFFSFVGRSTVESNEPTDDLMTTFMMDLLQIWSDLVAEVSSSSKNIFCPSLLLEFPSEYLQVLTLTMGSPTVSLRKLLYIHAPVQGLLTEQQLDTFNFPCYVRSVEEFRQDLESCGPLFHLLTARMQRIEVSASEVFGTSETSVLSTKMVYMIKSIVNNLLEAHVGQNASEIIWRRYEKLVETKIRMKPQNLLLRNSICFVSLLRN